MQLFWERNCASDRTVVTLIKMDLWVDWYLVEEDYTIVVVETDYNVHLLNIVSVDERADVCCRLD